MRAGRLKRRSKSGRFSCPQRSLSRVAQPWHISGRFRQPKDVTATRSRKDEPGEQIWAEVVPDLALEPVLEIGLKSGLGEWPGLRIAGGRFWLAGV